jgi:hemerythrin-like metal-binding protein
MTEPEMADKAIDANTLPLRANTAAADAGAGGHGAIARRLLMQLERLFERNAAAHGRGSGPHGLTQLALGNLLAWGSHLSVGDPVVDAQHEANFRLATQLHDSWRSLAPAAELGSLAERLRTGLEAHFSHEEALFAVCGHPGLGACRAEHRKALRDLDALRRRIAGGDVERARGGPGPSVLAFALGASVGHVLRDIENYGLLKKSVAISHLPKWPPT